MGVLLELKGVEFDGRGERGWICNVGLGGNIIHWIYLELDVNATGCVRDNSSLTQKPGNDILSGLISSEVDG
jgi:hypothetical protein